MGIERLNKAATAAGFAMATPDDDIEAAAPIPVETSSSRAVVVAEPVGARPPSPETVSTIKGWLKGYMPGFGGGRQPA